MELSYRSYQQVLNISLKPKTATSSCCKKSAAAAAASTTTTKRVSKPKRDESLIKRRTKTGCLTCRKRKKKCDEDKVNGKCQACTRNFLDCCWPDPNAVKPKTKKQPQQSQPPKQAEPLSPSMTSPIIRSKKCDINYLLQPEQPKPDAAAEPKVFIPYPSPTLSPVFSEAKPPTEVTHFALPPMYNVSYRHQSKDSNVRSL
ncbi:hypothetical protein Cantr_09792 [Candida viswanathii]|uniref:Zn(2)-C6 fungal-type domain-containing protein n=1 Tax=Candida viswanathii TaxID=5486 RepID=A0A367YCD1_9ASCO|nr:hypothetical protein Cantr_09792 [Candida viswanathii]